MRRHILLSVLSVTAVAACALGLTACGNKPAESNAGNKSDIISVQMAYSTATGLGYTGTPEEFASAVDRTDEVLKVELNAEGELIVFLSDGSIINLGVIETGCNHAYSEWTVGVVPTCTSIGYNSRECSKCGDIDYEILQAEGHKGENFTYNQSCHFFECAECGKHVEEEHILEDTVCTVCGYEVDYTLGLSYLFDDQTQSYTVIAPQDNALAELEEIVIPSVYKNFPVTAIAHEALHRAHKVEKIVIPESVTSIGNKAFWGLTALNEINIPSSVTSIGEHAFSFVTSLEEIVIPDSVKTIGFGLFSGCTALKSVTLPEGLTEIPNGTFMRCINLQTVDIPESVTTIGKNAFTGCTSLQSVNIPNGLTEISSGTFSSCTGLQKVEIPEGVSVIHMSAFSGCTGLTEVIFPESLTVVGEYAFRSCQSLSKITLPEGVITVGGYAFLNCTNLKSVTLPESLKHLGTLGVDLSGSYGYTFSGCTSLTEITLPASLTTIGEYTFENCKALTKVIFSEGLTRLSGHLFDGCENITQLVLPESLSYIGSGALVDCDKLTVITFNGTTAQWKAVEKESGWRAEDNIITNLKVSCSDGELEYIW